MMFDSIPVSSEKMTKTYRHKKRMKNVKNGNLSLVRDVSKVGREERTHKRRNKCTHYKY